MRCLIDSQYQQHTTTDTTIKIFLILYNIILWVGGLCLIWFGVWLKIEMYIFLMLNDAANSEFSSFLIFFSGIFVVFIVSLFFTCLIKIQKSMLFTVSVYGCTHVAYMGQYASCLIIIFFALLFLTIYLHMHKKNLLQNLPSGLRNSFVNSTHNQTLLLPFHDNTHLLMSTRKFNHGRENYLNFLKLHNNHVTEDCVKYFIFETSLDNGIHISKSYENCLASLETMIQKIFAILIVTISCIALFSLLGAVLSIGLGKMYHRVDYELIL